jgi:hypothetical protein
LDFSNFPPISHRFLLLLLSPAAAASAISRHFHQKMLAYSLIPSLLPNTIQIFHLLLPPFIKKICPQSMMEMARRRMVLNSTAEGASASQFPEVD